ncbi:hypothetical protein [Cypionkella sp.]|uniref:hypothetical protein n=1 Tax=Cypionkella sp. TaxID=2811411 RepID=UPI002AB987D9|nr:hypothetical protein [Cypionkella sp.]MDZ4394459.1 hypothetical protein [Cypionkella sp.]
MTDQLDLSEQQQEHLYSEMANTGFGDLRTAIDPNYMGSFDERSSEECIVTGFALIAQGFDMPPAELAPHQTAMLAASELSDADTRTVAMRAALAVLLKSVGLPADDDPTWKIDGV